MMLKRLIRSLGVAALLGLCMNAWSAHWRLVSATPEHDVLVDIDSIQRLANGDVVYLSRDVASRGYLPAGASEVLAIADTRYEMDCHRSMWIEKSTEYFSDEGKEVGRAPKVRDSWTPIEDQSFSAAVYKIIC